MRFAIYAVLIVGLVISPPSAVAQQFTADSAALPDWQYSSLDWGDYDNDGDLDLIFCGISGPSINSCDIFRNDAGTFVPIGAGLTGTRSGSAEWGDYDGDGDLDLVILGYGSGVTSNWVAKIYRNDGAGQCTDIAAGLAPIAISDAAWGDYDNDGDLDLIIMGSTPTGAATTLYRNNGGDSFDSVATGLPPMTTGSVAWGDYDQDGDLDLLLTGEDWAIFKPRTYLYRNDGGGVFTLEGIHLPDLYAGVANWGDYDQDGDLDILVDGSDSTGVFTFSYIYRNDGAGVFADINATLDGSGEGGAVHWGDADADGDLDVVMMASSSGGLLVWYYQSDSTFSDTLILEPSGCCGDIGWGDYNHDGRLDLAASVILNDHSTIYTNATVAANTSPSPPGTLTATVTGSSVELAWSNGNDAETSAPGLTYNLRVGTAPGLHDVMPAMANANTGQRIVARGGNTGSTQAWKLNGLPTGNYFWSVQSIDAGFAGSPFAPEQTFSIGDACPVVRTGDVNVSGSITSADIITLVGFVFKGGSAPLPCTAAGDINCTGDITSADIIALVNYVFKGGVSPCDVCALIGTTWSCP